MAAHVRVARARDPPRRQRSPLGRRRRAPRPHALRSAGSRRGSPGGGRARRGRRGAGRGRGRRAHAARLGHPARASRRADPADDPRVQKVPRAHRGLGREIAHREEQVREGEPAPRRVDRAPLQPRSPPAHRPDPGGQHRPDEGGRALRSHARLPLLDVRVVVDPSRDQPRARRQGPRGPHPGAHARHAQPRRARDRRRSSRARAASRRSRSSSTRRASRKRSSTR